MLKKATNFLLSILFLLFLVMATVALIVEYVNDYDLLEAKKADAMIVAKTAEKGLFLPPAYFAEVEFNGEKLTYLNRISKRQSKNLEPGDKLSGFSTGERDFSTVRSFLFDSFMYLVGIFIFGFFAFCVFIVLITKIKAVDEFIDRLEKKISGRFSGKWIGMAFLLFITSIIVYFSSLFLYNIWNKTLPIAKTKTEAYVIDKEHDIKYRRHVDSTFALTLHYFDEKTGEKLRTIKEVTRHTYNSYNQFDFVPISYRNSDHYDIFINKTTGIDALQAILYKQVLMYVIFIALLIWTAYYLYKKRKQKKDRVQR